MIRAAVIFLLVVVGATAADIDASRLAGALRLREGYRGVDGRKGERGPWQLRASVWRQQMPGRSFDEAREEGPSRACALTHIDWIAGRLAAHDLPVDAFRIALAWNAGVTAVVEARIPPSAWCYACDVEHLYNSTLRGAVIPPRTTTGPTARTCEERAFVRSIASQGVCLPSIHQRADRLYFLSPRMTQKPQPSIQVELPLQVQGATTRRKCTVCGRMKIATGGPLNCALVRNHGAACAGTLLELGPWDN